MNTVLILVVVLVAILVIALVMAAIAREEQAQRIVEEICDRLEREGRHGH